METTNSRNDPRPKEEELTQSTFTVNEVRTEGKKKKIIFTYYFNGTGSSIEDFQSKYYPEGEAISNMRHRTKGLTKGADGPGAKNPLHQHFSEARQIATGAGIEINIEDALTEIQNTKKWADEKGYDFEVNLAGWSRGAAATITTASKMFTEKKWGLDKVPVNIFGIDPVPGIGNANSENLTLHENVRDAMFVYAKNERSSGFSAVIPTAVNPKLTNVKYLLMPGHHATLAGNPSWRWGKDFYKDKKTYPDVHFIEPGKIVRWMLSEFLMGHGTDLVEVRKEFDKRLTKRELLEYFDKILNDDKGPEGSQYQQFEYKEAYTTTQKQGKARKVSFGPKNWLNVYLSDALPEDYNRMDAVNALHAYIRDEMNNVELDEFVDLSRFLYANKIKQDQEQQEILLTLEKEIEREMAEFVQVSPETSLIETEIPLMDPEVLKQSFLSAQLTKSQIEKSRHELIPADTEEEEKEATQALKLLDAKLKQEHLLFILEANDKLKIEISRLEKEIETLTLQSETAPLQSLEKVKQALKQEWEEKVIALQKQLEEIQISSKKEIESLTKTNIFLKEKFEKILTDKKQLEKEKAETKTPQQVDKELQEKRIRLEFEYQEKLELVSQESTRLVMAKKEELESQSKLALETEKKKIEEKYKLSFEQKSQQLEKEYQNRPEKIVTIETDMGPELERIKIQSQEQLQIEIKRIEKEHAETLQLEIQRLENEAKTKLEPEAKRIETEVKQPLEEKISSLQLQLQTQERKLEASVGLQQEIEHIKKEKSSIEEQLKKLKEERQQFEEARKRFEEEKKQHQEKLMHQKKDPVISEEKDPTHLLEEQRKELEQRNQQAIEEEQKKHKVEKDRLAQEKRQVEEINKRLQQQVVELKQSAANEVIDVVSATEKERRIREDERRKSEERIRKKMLSQIEEAAKLAERKKFEALVAEVVQGMDKLGQDPKKRTTYDKFTEFDTEVKKLKQNDSNFNQDFHVVYVRMLQLQNGLLKESLEKSDSELEKMNGIILDHFKELPVKLMKGELSPAPSRKKDSPILRRPDEEEKIDPNVLDPVNSYFNSLNEKLKMSPPLSMKKKVLICGVIGAVVGFVLGAVIGGMATFYGFGAGAIPLAFLGAFKGFTIGTAIGLSSAGFLSLFASSTAMAQGQLANQKFEKQERIKAVVKHSIEPRGGS